MFIPLLVGLSTPALADLPPPQPCDGLEDGDACTTENDEAGTCSDHTCVVSSTDGTSDDTGCATLAAPATATGATLMALGLLALGRRRS